MVERDNITLDGMGHIVKWTGIDDDQTGVYCLERNNVTVRDIVVRGFNVGVSFLEALSNNILESVIVDNRVGLQFENSSGAVISGNTIQNNSQAIFFSLMWTGANISNNNVIGNDRGISFSPHSGGDATISRNHIENNRIGIEKANGSWCSDMGFISLLYRYTLLYNFLFALVSFKTMVCCYGKHHRFKNRIG